MGGKAHADNSQIVKEQQQQAKDAAAKEALRQSRLSTGLQKIGYAFGGEPVTAPTSHTFDWTNFNNNTALPAGYTRVQVDASGKALAGTPAQAAKPGTSQWDDNRKTWVTTRGTPAVAAAPATGGITAIAGPDGRIYRPGEALSYTTNDPTGAVTGGFGDDFYNSYRDSVTNYYNPQVADQYKKATDELTYRLARAGSGDSSAGNTQIADLAKQNADNVAGVGNKADQAVGTLRGKIAGEQQKATSQLYATENPDVAANQALASVRDISLAQPDLSPLAQLFNIAAVGGANVMKNLQNQNFIGSFTSSLPNKQGSGVIVGT